MITETTPASYDSIMTINIHDTMNELHRKGVIEPCNHLTQYTVSAWQMIITSVHNAIMNYKQEDDYKYTMSMTTHRNRMNTIIINMSDDTHIIRIAAGLTRMTDEPTHNKSSNADMISSYGRNYKLTGFTVNAYGLSINATDLHEATMLVMSALE